MKRFLCLLLAVSFSSGCTDQGVEPVPWDRTPLFDESIHGTEITTGVDDRFRLEVEFFPDSGYSYFWSSWMSDPAVLALEKESDRVSSPSGRATSTTFYFHTKAEGNCTVKLTEFAAYTNRYVPPLDSVQFVVHVRR